MEKSLDQRSFILTITICALVGQVCSISLMLMNRYHVLSTKCLSRLELALILVGFLGVMLPLTRAVSLIPVSGSVGVSAEDGKGIDTRIRVLKTVILLMLVVTTALLWLGHRAMGLPGYLGATMTALFVLLCVVAVRRLQSSKQ